MMVQQMRLGLVSLDTYMHCRNVFYQVQVSDLFYIIKAVTSGDRENDVPS